MDSDENEGSLEVVVQPAPKKRRKKRVAKKQATNPQKWVEDEEFAGHLCVKDSILWCKFCHVSVTSTDRKAVRQHIFGSRASKHKREDTKHMKNKKRAESRRDPTITTFFASANAERTALIQEEDKLARRMRVANALMAAGIPFHKLQVPEFRDILEEDNHSLGGRIGLGECASPLHHF